MASPFSIVNIAHLAEGFKGQIHVYHGKRRILNLEKSGKVGEYDRKVFTQLADIVDGRVTDDQLKTSLSLFMRMMLSR